MAYRFQFPSNPRTLCMLESEEAGMLGGCYPLKPPATLGPLYPPRTLGPLL